MAAGRRLPVQAGQVLPLAQASTMPGDPLLRFFEKLLPFQKFKVDFSKLYPQVNRERSQFPAQRWAALPENLVQKALEVRELGPAQRELMQMEGGCGNAGLGEEGGEGGRLADLLRVVGGGRAGLRIFQVWVWAGKFQEILKLFLESGCMLGQKILLKADLPPSACLFLESVQLPQTSVPHLILFGVGQVALGLALAATSGQLIAVDRSILLQVLHRLVQGQNPLHLALQLNLQYYN